METPPPQTSSPQPYPPVEYHPAPPPSQKADAIFGITIGLVLILITPRFWHWIFTGNSGWDYWDAAGNPMPYTHSVDFPGDIAFALFCVSLIAEGIMLIVRRTRFFITTSLAITLVATLANLAFVIYMMQAGYGFQLYSGLATAFGLYILTYQWSLLDRRTLA